jgi:Na+(H+)/acetate symporter ActP
MPGPGASAYLLTWLVFGGLAAGGAAAALGAVRALPTARHQQRPGRLAIVLVASAGVLASLVPVGPWPLLVAALGLAASTLAPAAVLVRWSERATALGTAGGAGAGLAIFLLAAIGGAASPGDLADGWGSAVAAAPVAVAVPAHLLVAWLLRSRGTPSSRSSLSPGLEGLSIPAVSRKG